MIEVLEKEYGSVATVAPRAWRYRIWSPSQSKFLIINPDTDESVRVFGLLGLSPEEAEVTPVLAALSSGRWFIEGDEETERETYPCIIGNSIARELGVKVKDGLKLFSLDLTVASVVDDEYFESIVDLNQERITPLSYADPA